MKFNINESERNAILGMHKSAKILTENEMLQAADKEKKVVAKAKEKTLKLSDEERDVLKDFIEDNGPNVFMNLVKQEVNVAKGEGEMTEEDEESDEEGNEDKVVTSNMGETERQVRAIIDRIINYTAVGGVLGSVPAAMFISGGVGLALGISSLVALTLKDAAWWNPKKGPHGFHDKEMKQSRKDWHN